MAQGEVLEFEEYVRTRQDALLAQCPPAGPGPGRRPGPAADGAGPDVRPLGGHRGQAARGRLPAPGHDQHADRVVAGPQAGGGPHRAAAGRPVDDATEQHADRALLMDIMKVLHRSSAVWLSCDTGSRCPRRRRPPPSACRPERSRARCTGRSPGSARSWRPAIWTHARWSVGSGSVRAERCAARQAQRAEALEAVITAMAVLAVLALFVSACATGGTGARDEGPAAPRPVAGPRPRPRAPSGAYRTKVDAVALVKDDPRSPAGSSTELKPCVADEYPVDVSYGRPDRRRRRRRLVNVLTCGDAVGVGSYVYRDGAGRTRMCSRRRNPGLCGDRPRRPGGDQAGVREGRPPGVDPSGENVTTYRWLGRPAVSPRSNQLRKRLQQRVGGDDRRARARLPLTRRAGRRPGPPSYRRLVRRPGPPARTRHHED